MRMREWLIFILMCMPLLQSQVSSSKYQPGTVTAVTTHRSAPGEPDGNVARYDVSVKVGDTVYVVMYTPPNGANGVEYSAGLSVLVLVGSDTLTFNSKLTGTTVVPILHRETATTESGPDWSKMMSQYFATKQQHLSETLDLSEEQQIKIKPILEQEAGEAGQFLGNPVLSRKEQVSRWEKLVRASDAKIEPFLSQVQVKKLRELRKEQKQDLDRIAEAAIKQN
jgi:co-chaperonin GroES (HSP10)